MQAVDPGEQQKIMKLKSESNEKDKDHKVEWIYTGDKIDRDAYLLGKPIDKLLIEKELDKPKEDVFANTIDLANKIREDPLFEIKKREIEAKKRLLDNPLRLKQIEDQIKQPPQRNNYSESDSDNEFSRNKYNKKRNQKTRENHRDYRSNKYSRDDDRSNDRYNRNHHREPVDRHRRRSEDRSQSHKKSHKYSRNKSSDESSDNGKKYDKRRRNKSRSRSRSRSHDRKHSNKTIDRPGYGLINRRAPDDDSSNRRYEPKSAKQIEIEEIKKKIERLKQIRGNEDHQRSGQSYKKNAPKRLTEEEKQQRLAEMQDNAKWRENVRSNNMNNYKNEDKYEKKLHDESTSENSQVQASRLFNNMMHDAYASKEDRIKRNIKNLQRNEASFEKNFTKR